MSYAGTIIGSIALASIVVISIVGYTRANNMDKTYDERMKTLVDQINTANQYEYEFDKKHKAQTDTINSNVDDIRKTYVTQEAARQSIHTQSISNENLKSDKDLTETNKIRFSSKWTGFPDNAKDQSEISNDTAAFKKLMIVGNKAGGTGERRVGVWDRLDVHGNQGVDGWSSAQNTHGRDHVLAGNWAAWMRNDGWVESQNTHGRDHVLAGDWASWMRNDGNAQFKDTVSVGGQFHPDDVRNWGWKFGVQNNGGQAWLSHKDGYGMHINTNNQDFNKYALQTHNGKDVTAQINNIGDIYARGWDSAQNVQGRDHVVAGNWASWMRNDGHMKANRLQLGDKWQLSGVGDAHGNDGWLRLFNKDGTDYWGGIAAANTWSRDNSFMNQAHGNHYTSYGNGDWNWYEVRRGDGNMYFGGDNVNKGIWSEGDRPVTTYIKGKPTLSVGNDGTTATGTWNNQLKVVGGDYGSARLTMSAHGPGAGWVGSIQADNTHDKFKGPTALQLNPQGGEVHVVSKIRNVRPDPGSMLEVNYGTDTNRYGIGQWPNGTTRVYAATAHPPATVNLSLAKDKDTFEDVVQVNKDRIQMNKDVLVADKSLWVKGGDWGTSRLRMFATGPGAGWYSVINADDNHTDVYKVGSYNQPRPIILNQNGGAVGIGNVQPPYAPAAKLHVAGNTLTEGDATVNGALNVAKKWRLGDTGDDWLRLNGVGNATQNGYYGGLAAGRLWTAQNQLAGSDKRMKDNIQPLSKDEKDKIMKLNPTSYTMKDSEKKTKQFGLIAQEVENVYPNLVEEGPNGMKSLNYSGFIPVTIANIQELKKSVPNNESLCIGDMCLTKEDIKKIKNM